MGRAKKNINQIKAEIKTYYLLAIATAQKRPDLSAEYARRAEELEQKHGLSETTGVNKC